MHSLSASSSNHSRRSVVRTLLAVAICGLTLSQAASATTVLIDFGPNDTANGVISPGAGTMNANNGSTGVADSLGHFWNNAIVPAGASNTQSGGFTPKALSNLVASDNSPTIIGVSFSGSWKANGIQNGGLLAPSPSLLGDLGIPTATEDYFFVENANGTNGTASLTITNLDPSLTYNLDLFGTRNVASLRSTQYQVTDAFGTQSFTLQTSGTGSGSNGSLGNDDDIARFTGLVPNEAGSILVSVNFVNANGNTFGYLGAAKLVSVPEPSTGLLVITACLGLVSARRRRATL